MIAVTVVLLQMYRYFKKLLHLIDTKIFSSLDGKFFNFLPLGIEKVFPGKKRTTYYSFIGGPKETSRSLLSNLYKIAKRGYFLRKTGSTRKTCSLRKQRYSKFHDFPNVIIIIIHYYLHHNLDISIRDPIFDVITKHDDVIDEDFSISWNEVFEDRKKLFALGISLDDLYKGFKCLSQPAGYRLVCKSKIIIFHRLNHQIFVVNSRF